MHGEGYGSRFDPLYVDTQFYESQLLNRVFFFQGGYLAPSREGVWQMCLGLFLYFLFCYTDN